MAVRYSYLKVCLQQTSDGTKLVIGATIFDLLATSSSRLDCISVNMGPETKHFIPSDDTRIFIDTGSLENMKELMTKKKVDRSQTMPTLYQLKQVRSNFNRLSTYTMCRTSSSSAFNLQLQPPTIWMLSD